MWRRGGGSKKYVDLHIVQCGSLDGTEGESARANVTPPTVSEENTRGWGSIDWREYMEQRVTE